MSSVGPLSEIYDFTNVTDFEKFVQKLEESLSMLKLNNGWGRASHIGPHRRLLHTTYGDVELYYVHRIHYDLSVLGFVLFFFLIDTFMLI